jgi:hypothetical protein
MERKEAGMSRRVLRGLLPMTIALAAIGMGTTAASATAPLKETFVDEGIFTLPDVPCDGFVLREEMVSERIQITTYFDRAGDPVKIAMRANFFGEVTNSETGETFRDHVAFTETENVPAGTITVSGSSYHFVEAGEGQIYAEVGHKILVSEDGTVIFQAGQDDFTQTDLQGLCGPLA